jgi:hypothetical protein
MTSWDSLYTIMALYVKSGYDIHSDDDLAVQFASENGHLDVVKYLVSLGAVITANNNSAVQFAS